MMAFMVWMAVVLFIPVFAPSLSVLAFGEAMCGIPWGVFQVCCYLCYTVMTHRADHHATRPCRLRTPPKLFQQYFDLTSPHTSACAGAVVSSCLLASSAQLPVSKATWVGDYRSRCSSCGHCLCSSEHTLHPSHRGTRCDEERWIWPEGP